MSTPVYSHSVEIYVVDDGPMKGAYTKSHRDLITLKTSTAMYFYANEDDAPIKFGQSGSLYTDATYRGYHLRVASERDMALILLAPYTVETVKF